jgi:hypothetical protein
MQYEEEDKNEEDKKHEIEHEEEYIPPMKGIKKLKLSNLSTFVKNQHSSENKSKVILETYSSEFQH